MGYLHFFFQHRRLISFGILVTLLSSFGQTFFVSLFLPDFLSEYELSNSYFGLLYGLMTLIAGLSLPLIGSRLDHMDLRRFTLYTTWGLALSCLLIGLAPPLVIFVMGLLGLRLFGQGLMSHIAGTSMAKLFNRGRGKALSLSALGYSIGEGVLPLFGVLLIAVLGWQLTWTFSGAALLVIGPIIAFWLLPVEIKGETAGEDEIRRAPWAHLSENPSFWRIYFGKEFLFLVPSIILMPFLATALFLFQAHIADEKSWSLVWMASGFVYFAIARSAATLVIGPLIDQLTAIRLFPVFHLPMALGILVLLFGTHPWVVPFYYSMMGVTAGFGASIKSAIWAELYGTKKLAAIRSYSMMLMVAATAAAPAMAGLWFDYGLSVESFLMVSKFFIALALVTSYIQLKPQMQRT